MVVVVVVVVVAAVVYRLFRARSLPPTSEVWLLLQAAVEYANFATFPVERTTFEQVNVPFQPIHLSLSLSPSPASELLE